MDVCVDEPSTPAHERHTFLRWLHRMTTAGLEHIVQEMAALAPIDDPPGVDGSSPLPAGMLIVRALADLQRATPRHADERTLARSLGMAEQDIATVLQAGIAAGYIAQDFYGALRLTGTGWRFHISNHPCVRVSRTITPDCHVFVTMSRETDTYFGYRLRHHRRRWLLLSCVGRGTSASREGRGMQQDHDTRDTRDTATGSRKQPTVRDQALGPALTMQVFGPPILRLGDALLVFSRRKTTALLLYLAITRRTHTRDALANLLWGEMAQARAMANLRKSLSELRERVGAAVNISFHTVAINPDYRIALDVADFEAAVARGIAAGDVPLLTQAVARYPQDLLAGFNLPEAEAFDEWASLYREHLREQLIAALATLVMLYTERGAYRAALEPARRVVALDPWREEGQRQLMRVLAATGDRAAAVAQYAVCRKSLAEELGVEPSADTETLYECVLRGTASPHADRDRPAQGQGPEQVCEPVRDRAHKRRSARRFGRSLLRASALPGLLAGAARPGDRVSHDGHWHPSRRIGRRELCPPYKTADDAAWQHVASSEEDGNVRHADHGTSGGVRGVDRQGERTRARDPEQRPAACGDPARLRRCCGHRAVPRAATPRHRRRTTGAIR